MRSILYIVAVVLVIGWLLGFFVYGATGLIHILIVLAIISLLVGLIQKS
ncbi:MAG: lmo0937 family membrane protein [Bacteroidota bacterium]